MLVHSRPLHPNKPNQQLIFQTYPLKVYRHRLNTGHPNPFDNDYHPGDPEKSDVSSDEDFNPSDPKPHRNVKFSAEQKARRIEKIRKKKEKDIERFGREVDEVEVEEMIYWDEREVIPGYHGTGEGEEHEEGITENRDEEDGVLGDVEDLQEDFGDFVGEDAIKDAIEDTIEDAVEGDEEDMDVDADEQGVLMSEELEDIYMGDHDYFK
ncbi:hypothetical protein GCK72_009140 [Caenorhabditis remanei]|uniref:Uncharacterized protein n=1 Tax=Caenorhabditis remanei TaxID=31234 RepID=A0A6A5H1I9_CAERE|nr:hypothetical protein GCK72_009140 [Caenorhabditis remanei]KAF1760889.1 hypothetical protein GCK72_009140 [Caenorhabditis remanei]